jgi:hypothetical protein
VVGGGSLQTIERNVSLRRDAEGDDVESFCGEQREQDGEKDG